VKDNLKVDIPLAIVGCDFRAAATVFRESLVTDPGTRADLFLAIRRNDPTAGFMALETCNRVEWIVSTKHPDWMAELLKARMVSMWQTRFQDSISFPNPISFISGDAVRHLLNVVVGQESLAVGEAQIAGQFQDALNKTREEKTTSVVLNRLGSAAGRLAKAGHRVGFRSNHRQGIHGLVNLYFQRHWQQDETPRKIIVVGMGTIGRKTAQLLEEQPRFQVIRVNRTIKPEHRKVWRNTGDLPNLSRDADAIVMATGGLEPVLNAEALHLDGRDRPLLIMDIGVPRQVTEDVRKSKDIRYRDIDHLLDLPQEMENPEIKDRLDKEIRKEMDRFVRFCMERDMVRLLDGIHRGSQQYVYQRIPAFIESQLGDLDDKTRKTLENAMQRFIQEYAHDIHSALQTALEEYWEQK
jgi:glutamyl-tRNA reductase